MTCAAGVADRLRSLGGPVRAGVVDDDDVVDEVGHGRHSAANEPLLVVGGNDHRHPKPSVH